MGVFRDLLGTVLKSFSLGPVGVRGTLDASGLTANRSYVLPDKSGTLATTADVGGGSEAAANSISFAYTDGVITSSTETFGFSDERVTTFSYTDYVLTQAVAVRGAETIITTFDYTNNVLTGVTVA